MRRSIRTGLIVANATINIHAVCFPIHFFKKRGAVSVRRDGLADFLSLFLKTRRR